MDAIVPNINIVGHSNGRINSIEFITSLGTVYGPFGTPGSGTPWLSAHPGCKLTYLSGNAGERLDSISLHYYCDDSTKNKETKKSVIEEGPFGGNGGSAWTDGTGVNLNGHITAIQLRAANAIDGIRAR